MRTESYINRKQTAFRLSEDLLDRLKIAAKRENRSLNNYVEHILMEVVSLQPNQTTVNAMKEGIENKNLETLDLDHFEEFISSL